MRVTVEFYGILRQVMGTDSCVVTPAGNTVADTLGLLCEQQPTLAGHIARVACALGDTLVARNHPLSDNAVLSLIPPVSGG